MMLLKALIATAFLLPTTVLACSFDTDCSPGSKCSKAPGSIYGVCIGGISPGNKNDRQPVYDPLDPNRTTGNTCSFDTDCGPGSKCVKSIGSIDGACLRQQQGIGSLNSQPLRTPPRPGESYFGHVLREQTERQQLEQEKIRPDGCNPRVQGCGQTEQPNARPTDCNPRVQRC